MKPIDSCKSNQIWIIKGFAIFTVFFAHMPWRGDNPIMAKLFELLGVVGVPIFLFLSGYLDYGSKSTLSKRIKSLYLPVIIWASISFALSSYLHRGGGDYIRHFLGLGSVYYFVTVLLLCILLSRFINKWLLLILSICTIIFGAELIPYNHYFTPYLNPFNFLLYFLLGGFARKYEVEIPYDKLFLTSLLGAILMVGVGVIWPNGVSYFSWYCIPFAIGAFLLMYSLTKLIQSKFWVLVGKASFVIYLMHIQIAGFINARMNNWLEYIKVPIAFLIVVLVVLGLQWFVSKVFKKDSVSKCLGFR